MTTAILLSAGLGTRLLPLTEVLAKPAIPLLDRPLAMWGLDTLASLEVTPILVNVSHRPETVRAALAGRDVEFFLEEPEGFGTAGTLRALADQIQGRVVTCNGDLVSDLRAADVLATHERSGASATIAVQQVEKGADFDRDGRYVDRRERRDEPGVRYLGMSVVDVAVVRALPDRRPLGLAGAILAPMHTYGDIAFHVHEGFAYDVGTLQSYLATSIALADGGRYVGPGAHVEPGSLGPGAIVLAGAEVGHGARIERSIVWPNEKVPPGTELKSCIFALGRIIPVPSGP